MMHNSISNILKIVLITGMSGSGKSVALNGLEDNGYYCVDNLPPILLPSLIKHLNASNYKYIAVSVDARSGDDFQYMKQIIKSIKQKQHEVEIIFLDASDEILLQRFSETRRPHPLNFRTTEQNLSQVIIAERKYLEVVKDIAYKIDTTNLQNNKLQHLIKNIASQAHQNKLLLSIKSFGFKYGVPRDLDFIFDVRHLPNPFYYNQLKNLTGLHEEIKQFFMDYAIVDEQITDIVKYFNKWLPSFIENNRAYLTIGIGCTGGQHRSVYVVESIAKLLDYNNLLVEHREINI